MGRPLKQGIDSFPLEVDFFSNTKVRKVAKACGPNATAVIICLLCKIYRNGYCIECDEDLVFSVADQIGIEEDDVREIITKAVEVDYFSNNLYEKYQILTSAGIQKHFVAATYKRKERVMDGKYLVSDVRNEVSDRRNSVKVTQNQQSKEKVKEKENTTNVVTKKVAAKAATSARKQAFYDSLIPYLGQYPKEMIREFFNYWSELNKSGTKMRYELQKTWELHLRLSTWANREKVAPGRKDEGPMLRNSTDKVYKQEW